MSSMALTRGMVVRIRESQALQCNPKPQDGGFIEDCLYRCLAVTDYSETSEAYMLLINDCNEFWFIPSRHCRFAGWEDERTGPAPWTI